MAGYHTSSLEPNPSRTMNDHIHPEGIIPTGPYRDDLASVTARLQARERELAELRFQLQEKEDLLTEAEDKENARVSFYLEFVDDEIKRLEAENKRLEAENGMLHQQVIRLSGGLSVDLVNVQNRMVGVQHSLAEFRRTVSIGPLVVLGILFYLFSGWLIL